MPALNFSRGSGTPVSVTRAPEIAGEVVVYDGTTVRPRVPVRDVRQHDTGTVVTLDPQRLGCVRLSSSRRLESRQEWRQDSFSRVDSLKGSQDLFPQRNQSLGRSREGYIR